MAVKTGSLDSAALVRLDALRLANDWSFRQLSSDMQRVGVIVSAQTLHQLLTDRDAKPYDRTLYKIRKYFEALDAERPRRKRVAS
jgi:hypothetical protein